MQKFLKFIQILNEHKKAYRKKDRKKERTKERKKERKNNKEQKRKVGEKQLTGALHQVSPDMPCAGSTSKGHGTPTIF